MAIGFIDKDFVDEGPFLVRFHSIQILDPAILGNVKLWFSTPNQKTTWYMGDGVYKQEDVSGEEFYDFNVDTRRARELMDDGSLATEVVEEENEDTGEMEENEVALYNRLRPDRRYDAFVTYTSEAVTDIRAVGARAEILVRSAGPIL